MLDFCLREGALVTVCNEGDADSLGQAYVVQRSKAVRWQLGPSYLKGIEQFDIIVRSPGVPLSLPSLKKARSKGAVITSLTKEFFARCPASIIGVTGTKGKGTTSTLIAQILAESRRRVHLLGNIGLPAMAELPKIKKNDWVIYELSSFQLQDLEQSPSIAVVLGLTIDHQDYHRTVKEYYEAKSNILKHQTIHNAAILNIDYPETEKFKDYVQGKYFQVSRTGPVANGAYVLGDKVVRYMNGKEEDIIAKRDVGLKGDHNLENVMPAIVAATLAGATLPAICKVLKTFRGLPHRLEPVGEVDGVQFWNNSFGTTPETTIAAIRAFQEPIVLLAGGSEKGNLYDTLGKEIMNSSVKVIVGIGKTATKIYAATKAAAKASGRKPPSFIEGGMTMKEMVATARKFTKPGDVVLLAPGSASFDRFANYTERGEQFKREVKGLQNKV